MSWINNEEFRQKQKKLAAIAVADQQSRLHRQLDAAKSILARCNSLPNINIVETSSCYNNFYRLIFSSERPLWHEYGILISGDRGIHFRNFFSISFEMPSDNLTEIMPRYNFYQDIFKIISDDYGGRTEIRPTYSESERKLITKSFAYYYGQWKNFEAIANVSNQAWEFVFGWIAFRFSFNEIQSKITLHFPQQ